MCKDQEGLADQLKLCQQDLQVKKEENQKLDHELKQAQLDMQSLKSAHAKKIAEISFSDKLKKDNTLEFQKAQ